MENEIDKLEERWIWMKHLSKESRDTGIAQLGQYGEDLKFVLEEIYDNALTSILMASKAAKKG